MAGLIDHIIGKSPQEYIRDKVVNILGTELDNQFLIGGDYVLDTDVWMERTVIFGENELKPAVVNVQITDGSYENQDVRSIVGTYQIAIDCYCKGAATDSGNGDTFSMVGLQRLVSVIRSILMDSRYKDLGFGNDLIRTRRVSSIQYFEYNRQKEVNNDTDYITSARMILTVVCNENVDLLDANIEKGSDTAVNLLCTDKGYVWSREGCYTGEIPYTPCKTCDFSVSLYNSNEKPLYVINQDSNNPFVLGDVIVIDGQGNEITVPYDPTIPITTPLCPVVCAPATAVLKNTSGTELSTTSINSGASGDVIAPDGAIRLNAIGFGSVLSGATRVITVRYENGNTVGTQAGSDLVIPNPITCADCTVNVNGNLFNTVASGGTLNVLVEYESGGSVGAISGNKVLIPDPSSCENATAVLKDTDGNDISTTPIASGATANIIAPDGSVNVENSQSVIIAAGLVKSNGSLLLSVDDSTAVLKDSAGTVISSTDIPSEQSADVTAPDGTITINSAAFDTVLSGATKNVLVKDGTGAQVGSKVGSEWIVPTLEQTTNIHVLFDVGADLDYTITINANSAGTYTSASFSGGMASATYEKNGVPTTLPFTLAATNTLRIIPNAEGAIELTGTY